MQFVVLNVLYNFSDIRYSIFKTVLGPYQIRNLLLWKTILPICAYEIKMNEFFRCFTFIQTSVCFKQQLLGFLQLWFKNCSHESSKMQLWLLELRTFFSHQNESNEIENATMIFLIINTDSSSDKDKGVVYFSRVS